MVHVWCVLPIHQGKASFKKDAVQGFLPKMKLCVLFRVMIICVPMSYCLGSLRGAREKAAENKQDSCYKGGH